MKLSSGDRLGRDSARCDSAASPTKASSSPIWNGFVKGRVVMSVLVRDGGFD